MQSSAEATGLTANTGPAACGVIPPIAEAYSFNVTVIPQSGTVNYVTVWPAGPPQPVVSTLNATQGLIVANAAIVPAGTEGSVNLYNSGPASINVVIDMNGYFAQVTNPGAIAFADYYAQMPPNNTATVGVGTDVPFPVDGSSGGISITRSIVNPTSSFVLSTIGSYQVMFQASVTEPGQLDLTLDGTELLSTVVGRATGTSQIVGMAIVTTSAVNSVLTVRNPAANSSALTLTPIAGGADPVSAHLVITQIH